MRRRSPYILLINILISLGFLPAVSHGFPLPQQTLWDLTEEADVIVLAHVDKTDRAPLAADGSPSRNSGIATLSVRQALKGAPAAVISVEYPEGMICPSPPHFYLNKQVLAFLDKHDQHYQSVAMWQGTLYLKPNELNDYRNAIQEAVALQAAQPVTLEAQVRWMVHTAARPATRWHGLYGLLPHQDESWLFPDRKGVRPSPKGTRLTPDQLKEIADSFVAHPATDHTLRMLLNVLKNYASTAVDQTAIGIVEGALAQDTQPLWLREAIDLLRARLKDPKAKAAALRPSWEDVPLATLRQEWQSVRKRLHLPTVAPIKAPPS